MLINLMNSKKGIELYNLLLYGIEGTHYEVVEELEDDKIIKKIPFFFNRFDRKFDTFIVGNTCHWFSSLYAIMPFWQR